MGGVRWLVTACVVLPGLTGCVGVPTGYPGYSGAYPPGAPYASAYPGERYAVVDDPAPARPPVRTPVRPRPRPVTPVAAATPYVAKQPEAQATPAVATGPECRTVTELTYVDGKEVRQEQRYCRTPPSREWVKS